MISIGCTVPRTLEAWVIATSVVAGPIAARIASGSTYSLSGGNPGERDDPALLDRPQRPTHRIVLQVRGDDVVAGPDQPLDRQVQPIGAVMSEDPPLGALPTKELIEPMPRVIEHLFGRQSHSMPRSPRVGQTRSGESIHCLIDRLGLGKAGGGIVEINHGRFQKSGGGRTMVPRRRMTLCRMANDTWQMTDDRWQMANGRWQMADGRWQMTHGR